MSTTPFNRSERMFRTYEPHIVSTYVNWPKVSIFDPDRYSVETFSCRMRDSINAWLANKWPLRDERVKNILVFEQTLNDIVVSTSFQLGKVAAGPYEELRSGKQNCVEAGMTTIETKQSSDVVVTSKLAVINALLILHSERVLIEPTTVRTAQDIDKLASAYDVFVERLDNGDWIIT